MTVVGDQVVEVDGGPVIRLRNLEVEVVVLATSAIKKVTLQENVLMPVEVVAAELASNVVRTVTCPGNVPVHHQEVGIESVDALIVAMKDTCQESVLNRRKNVVPVHVTNVVKKATCHVIVPNRMVALLEEEVGEPPVALTRVDMLIGEPLPIPDLQVPLTGELGDLQVSVKRRKAVVSTAAKMDTCRKIAHNLGKQEMQVELAEGVAKEGTWRKIVLRKFLMRKGGPNPSR